MRRVLLLELQQPLPHPVQLFLVRKLLGGDVLLHLADQFHQLFVFSFDIRHVLLQGCFHFPDHLLLVRRFPDLPFRQHESIDNGGSA
ncbi:hypothetical protein VQ056_30670 [Paenibacillus sp. JTLBN-2024]